MQESLESRSTWVGWIAMVFMMMTTFPSSQRPVYQIYIENMKSNNKSQKTRMETKYVAESTAKMYQIFDAAEQARSAKIFWIYFGEVFNSSLFFVSQSV